MIDHEKVFKLWTRNLSVTRLNIFATHALGNLYSSDLKKRNKFLREICDAYGELRITRTEIIWHLFDFRAIFDTFFLGKLMNLLSIHALMMYNTCFIYVFPFALAILFVVDA